MESPTYVALSAQVALRQQLEVVANNVANANTTGYKPDKQIFQSYLSKLNVPGGSVSFVQDRATFIDVTEGPMNPTGNSLDIAVKGDGMLAVAGPGGQTLYTRDGHLQTGQDGTLQTVGGLPVLGPDGSQIQLPPDYTRVRITADGQVTVRVKGNDQQVGQIGLYRTDRPQMLRKQGAATFSAPPGAMNPVEQGDTRTGIVQGALEGSTVQPVREIANLTELSRAYDRLQTLLSDDSDREKKMIETLGSPQ